MQLNIKIKTTYEICTVDNNKTSTTEVVVCSPLEAMWAAYRTVVNLKTYSTFEEWQRDFDVNSAAVRLERLKKIKYIKSKEGAIVFISKYLNQ